MYFAVGNRWSQPVLFGDVFFHFFPNTKTSSIFQIFWILFLNETWIHFWRELTPDRDARRIESEGAWNLVPVKLRNRPIEQLFLGGLSHFLLIFFRGRPVVCRAWIRHRKVCKIGPVILEDKTKKGIRAHDRLETNIIRALHHLKFDKSLSFLSVDLTL